MTTSLTCRGDSSEVKDKWIFFITISLIKCDNGVEDSLKLLSINSCISMHDSREAEDHVISSWIKMIVIS